MYLAYLLILLFLLIFILILCFLINNNKQNYQLTQSLNITPSLITKVINSNTPIKISVKLPDFKWYQTLSLPHFYPPGFRPDRIGVTVYMSDLNNNKIRQVYQSVINAKNPTVYNCEDSSIVLPSTVLPGFYKWRIDLTDWDRNNSVTTVYSDMFEFKKSNNPTIPDWENNNNVGMYITKQGTTVLFLFNF